jgi:hypothetical protein
MIYRGPCFLEVVRFCDFAPRAPPSLFSPVSNLDRRHTGKLRKRNKLLKGGRGWARNPIIQPQESLVLCKSFIEYSLLETEISQSVQLLRECAFSFRCRATGRSNQRRLGLLFQAAGNRLAQLFYPSCKLKR